MEVSRLKKFAKQGSIISELEQIGVLRYRELILHPWRITYRAEKEIIYIIAVIDGRRNVEDILLRRNIR
jgi:toxin ParE1/3/4